MVTYTNSGAVLGATQGAAGLSARKDRFCWTPEDDTLFALGWPHLRLIDAGHPDDKNPEKKVAKSIDKSIEGHYFVRWPQQVALRYVRAFGGRQAGAFTLRNNWVAKAAGSQAKPITEHEAREMLADRVRHGGPAGSWFTEHFALLLEALVGPRVVLDSLTMALEGDVGTDEEVYQLGYTLGFLLLRVAPAVAEQQRARLQAVLEGAKPGGYLSDGLSCSLGGAQAAQSMGLNPSFYHHATDDPQAVRGAVEAGQWLPSARLVFIGGEAVLETIAVHWKRQRDTELQRKLAAQLSLIRSPLAVRILADMAARSKAKKKLPKICAPYLDHMRPDLEALTKDVAVAAGAEALLAAGTN